MGFTIVVILSWKDNDLNIRSKIKNERAQSCLV